MSVPVAAAQDPPEAVPADVARGAVAAEEQEEQEEPRELLILLPFRIHSARPLGVLTRSLSKLLAGRLKAGGELGVVPSDRVEDELKAGPGADLSDLALRSLAKRLGAVAVVSGSLTELAGHFSLDARVTPVEGTRSHTIVMTTTSEEELLGRLDELASRVTSTLSGVAPSVLADVIVESAGDLEVSLRAKLGLRPGDLYDPEAAHAARVRLEEDVQVATVTLATELTAQGVVLRFQVVRAEMIFGDADVSEAGEVVGELRIRGNQRIESDAIRARIRTKAGEPLRRTQIASDVREIFNLGFFANVEVFESSGENGLVLIFEVEENPVIRQISLSGNDGIESDKIRDALTLTTGSTLDYPLLHENTARIESLYRAEGYFLARVGFEIEELREGSISINFEVEENDKLHLKEILFEGNEAFTAKELTENFATKEWVPIWSTLTGWLTKAGTYSEPLFVRDVQSVEKLYTDKGYLQVEIGEPEVEPRQDGLYVRVRIREGPQFRVGTLSVTGDATIDLEALREKLRLEEGEVFNRSALTADVEELERFYADRGFFFARVTPATVLNQEDLAVEVEFRVEKGPLYFIRHIEVSGNTRTVDRVIRREMRMVEGQLYSARALQLSNTRVRRLGFFEDVSFDFPQTPDPSQLDLEVGLVERPTGAFSFGAGFSSQDKFVLSASLNNSNAFGRGYGVSLTAEYGGSTQRFFMSINDPYFLGTTFSMGATFFMTTINFQDFEQEQTGVDFSVGHALNEANTARAFARYSFAQRRIVQNTNVNAASPLLREIRQQNESTSLIGLSFRSDTRDDRFAPTSGMTYGAGLEFAGLGGFASFLRAEGNFTFYQRAPDWLLDQSAFVFSAKLGYVVPFNSVDDFDLGLGPFSPCSVGQCDDSLATLDQIDRDLKLPLTDRYFLGGIGSFQLRGFKARYVGRLCIILRSIIGASQDANDFTPVGRQLVSAPGGGFTAVCIDDGLQQGNGNGRCNDLGDKDIDDFDDLDETDVIGGNSFVTTSFEYRFPISQDAGLMSVVFLDMGNAFYEGQNLFDVTEWRYGWGGGLLWFSPFGPLQVVLGFPIDPLEVESSPVFEFSVGGFSQ